MLTKKTLMRLGRITKDENRCELRAASCESPQSAGTLQYGAFAFDLQTYFQSQQAFTNH